MASEPRTFSAVDPATGAIGPVFVEATETQISAAVGAAALVHTEGQLRDPAVRALLLRAAAQCLRDDGEAIKTVCRSETGLTEARLAGELERTASQFEKFANVVDNGDEVDATIDLAVPEAAVPVPDVRRMLVPIGPVVVFGASNFPLAFGAAGGDTASALAAGCPVIVKGHPSHPGTSELVARALTKAVAQVGLPQGVFALLQSSGPELGQLLVEQPSIAAIAFTGSREAGCALARAAAARPTPIPVFAEMGSVNPVVITAGALRERADTIRVGLAAAVTGSGGQLCTKPGVVLLPAGEAAERFAAQLIDEFEAAQPEVLLNSAVYARFQQALGRIDDDLAASTSAGETSPGFVHQPVVARAEARALSDRPELLDEIFGPFVLLVTYDDTDELTTVLSGLEGQLTASIQSEPTEAQAIAGLLPILIEKVGRIVFNGYATGVAVNYAMQHGGPYPATTAPGTTSVGMTALRRFVRPVAWQAAPDSVLPAELQNANPLKIQRRVNGALTREAIPPESSPQTRK